MWLGAICALVGLVLGGFVFNGAVVRGAVGGLAVGLVLALIVNVVVPTPATCLQNSKGFDILRAYKLC